MRAFPSFSVGARALNLGFFDFAASVFTPRAISQALGIVFHSVKVGCGFQNPEPSVCVWWGGGRSEVAGRVALGLGEVESLSAANTGVLPTAEPQPGLFPQPLSFLCLLSLPVQLFRLLCLRASSSRWPHLT